MRASQPDRIDHQPVLVSEVLEGLRVRAHGRYLDGTLGSAGHAAAILEQSAPDGRLLGLDKDPAAVARAVVRLAEFGDRAVLRVAPFEALDTVARAEGMGPFDGLLLDLGISSVQLDDPSRGFTFQAEGPLDMRIDPAGAQTAAELVNNLDEESLANLIFQFGEEPRSRRIARAIVAARPVASTSALAGVVARASGYPHGRTHPATRTFQALRIAVNDELGTLERTLPKAIEALAPHGRLAVITFHSLEDRIVKQTFRQAARDCICPPRLPECRCDHVASLKLVTRRPVSASPAELASNPRARSAKLRVAERVAPSELDRAA
jgi:16S rRNA (cytosine1402-N4)-methyltransferase